MAEQIRYSWDTPRPRQVLDDSVEVSGWFYLSQETGHELFIQMDGAKYRCDRYARDLTSVVPDSPKDNSCGFRCIIPISGSPRIVPLTLSIIPLGRAEMLVERREVFFPGPRGTSLDTEPKSTIPAHQSDLSRDFLYRNIPGRILPCNVARLREVLEALRSEHGTSRVLDFACGHGDVVRYLRSYGFQVQGVEPSKYLVESLNSADAVHPTQKPPVPGQYDLLICMDFLSQQNPDRVEDYLCLFREINPAFLLVSVRLFFDIVFPNNCIRPAQWWRTCFRGSGFEIVEDCTSERMKSIALEKYPRTGRALNFPFRSTPAEQGMEAAYFLLKISKDGPTFPPIERKHWNLSRNLNFACLGHNAWKHFENLLRMVDPQKVRAFTSWFLTAPLLYQDVTESRLRSYGVEPTVAERNQDILDILGPNDLWMTSIEGDGDYGLMYAASYTLAASLCGARTGLIQHGATRGDTRPVSFFSDRVFVHSQANVDYYTGPSPYVPDLPRYMVDRSRLVISGSPQFDAYFQETPCAFTDLFGDYYRPFNLVALIATHFDPQWEDYSPSIEMVCRTVLEFPDVLFVLKVGPHEKPPMYSKILDCENLILLLDDMCYAFDFHLTRLLKAVDLLISIPSTCYLEGVLAGVPTVLLLPQVMRIYDEQVKDFFGQVPIVKTIEDIRTIIDAVQSRNKAVLSDIRVRNEPFADRNYAREIRGCSAERVFKEMEQEHWTPSYRSKEELWNRYNMSTLFCQLFATTRKHRPHRAPRMYNFPEDYVL
ncbi:MAG TPA: methyltransferase domain-containing protein [bacterium]|nr:methyltransferase domain-containing protein [bacterium]